MSNLYTLYINLLSNTWHKYSLSFSWEKMSHSFPCWFPLLCRSFLIWWGSLVFPLLPLLLEPDPKKSLSRLMSRRLTRRTSMVSGLKFKSLTQFELIFYVWCKMLALYYSIWFSNFPNTTYWYLLKKLSFLHCIFLLFCHTLIDHLCMGLFMASLFYFIDLCICFYAHTILFWLLYFCNRVKAGCLIPPVLLFFLNIALTLQDLSWFHTNFSIIPFPWEIPLESW